MIEEEISYDELMRRANISVNIKTKIKNGQYVVLGKVKSTCFAINCTPNDILEFVYNENGGLCGDNNS